MEEEFNEEYYNDQDVNQESNRTSSHQWWHVDFSYLPIHFFQKQIKLICQQLSNKNITWNETDEIISNFWTKIITKKMLQEYYCEYKYAYGKGLIENHKIISLGYIEGMKQYLIKIIHIYVHMSDKNSDRSMKLKNHILESHKILFCKKRYWDDDEIDRIDNIINKLE